MEANNTVKILEGLASEISTMTEKEKKFSLKRIAQAEINGNKNKIWATIAKRLLLDEELASKFIMCHKRLLSTNN